MIFVVREEDGKFAVFAVHKSHEERCTEWRTSQPRAIRDRERLKRAAEIEAQGLLSR